MTLPGIDQESVRAVTRFDVAPHNNRSSPLNAASLAEYTIAPKACTQAVRSDDTAVDSVVVFDDPGAPEYSLSRFMTDRRSPRMGFGRRAIDLVINYVRIRPGAPGLATSCLPLAG